MPLHVPWIAVRGSSLPYHGQRSPTVPENQHVLPRIQEFGVPRHGRQRHAHALRGSTDRNRPRQHSAIHHAWTKRVLGRLGRLPVPMEGHDAALRYDRRQNQFQHHHQRDVPRPLALEPHRLYRPVGALDRHPEVESRLAARRTLRFHHAQERPSRLALSTHPASRKRVRPACTESHRLGLGIPSRRSADIAPSNPRRQHPLRLDRRRHHLRGPRRVQPVSWHSALAHDGRRQDRRLPRDHWIRDLHQRGTSTTQSRPARAPGLRPRHRPARRSPPRHAGRQAPP